MWASLSLLRTLPRTVTKMYDVSDYLRDQAALRSCEEHYLSDDYDDSEYGGYPDDGVDYSGYYDEEDED